MLGPGLFGGPAMNPQTVQAGSYPVFAELLPGADIEEGRYRLGFARSAEELAAIQRLRFEVFNLELHEGLAESFETGLDQDRFDPYCHHLVVTERKGGTVVGTYRVQTSEMAAAHEGFYSAGEYQLERLPDAILSHAVETGRACVARAHRNRMVLFLLWKGLAAYMRSVQKRYLFGCCSLTSQDPVIARLTMDKLEADGKVHPEFRLPVQPGWGCYDADFSIPAERSKETVDLPRLFRTYLRYGAQVISEPALDREFKTIDYLVLFDLEQLDPASRAMFMGK